MDEIQIMHGRKVLVNELPEELQKTYFCFDCGARPTVLVTEIGKLPIKWNPIKSMTITSWFWCGTCDIGG